MHTLAKNGDLELAVGLLEDPTCDVEGAVAVLHFAEDPGLKRRALVAARERWRARRRPTTRHGDWLVRDFYSAVSRHWRVLEREEASRWLDEILLAIESDPDERAGYEVSHDVQLHSSRDICLFEVLNVVRALKSARDVEEILARHADVSAAAQVFPLGRESVEQANAPAGEGSQGDGFCYFGSGDARDIDLAMAVHRREPSAPARLLEEAHRKFREDTDLVNGNFAPLPFWPSCLAYRRALYWGGRLIGSDAKSMVTDVPDRDLALLSSVELAAGLLGLDEFGWVWMAQHRATNEDR